MSNENESEPRGEYVLALTLDSPCTPQQRARNFKLYQSLRDGVPAAERTGSRDGVGLHVFGFEVPLERCSIGRGSYGGQCVSFRLDKNDDCYYRLLSYITDHFPTKCDADDEIVRLTAELAEQLAENTRLMSLVGEAMNPPTGDYRAEVIAAHLWLTQAGVPSAQTLAERVKLLVEQRDEARDHLRVCEEQFDALGEANEQNVRMEPLRSVLRSWDWNQLLEDERIPDEAVMPLLRAFAYVEAEENKAKQAKEADRG